MRTGTAEGGGRTTRDSTGARAGPAPVLSRPTPARCRQRFSRDSRTGRAADRHDDQDFFRAARPPLPRAAGQRAGLRPGQDHGDGRPGPPLAPPGPAGAGVQDRPRLHRSDGARARQRRAVPAARFVDGRRGPLPRTALAGRRRSRPDPGRGRDGTARRQHFERRAGRAARAAGAGGDRRQRDGADLRGHRAGAEAVSAGAGCRRRDRQPRRQRRPCAHGHRESATGHRRVRRAAALRGAGVALAPPGPGAGHRAAGPGAPAGSGGRRGRTGCAAAARTGALHRAGRGRGPAAPAGRAHRGDRPRRRLRLSLSGQCRRAGAARCAHRLLLAAGRRAGAGPGRCALSARRLSGTASGSAGGGDPHPRHDPCLPRQRPADRRRVRRPARAGRRPERSGGPTRRDVGPAAGRGLDAAAPGQPRHARGRPARGHGARPHLPPRPVREPAGPRRPDPRRARPRPAGGRLAPGPAARLFFCTSISRRTRARSQRCSTRPRRRPAAEAASFPTHLRRCARSPGGPVPGRLAPACPPFFP